jgi:hypothetical protein
MKVKNTAKRDIYENLFGFGEVRIAAGETADIPDEVAKLWLNPSRQEVCIEVVGKEAQAEAPVEKAVVAPKKNQPKQAKAKEVEEIPEQEDIEFDLT